VKLRISEITRVWPSALAAAATIVIGFLVYLDGQVPSAFTTLFFIPIIFVAYRYSLQMALLIAGLASVFSSPAMELLGVKLDPSVKPVLWLGWPAVYLFLAVSLNQWSSIQQQRSKLEATERGLMDVSARNDRRERELETLSAIHTTILKENDEQTVVDEITRRVAEVCGAKICTITVPIGTTGQRPFLPVGFTDEVFNRFFPDGAPYGEGVDGWAMLHRRVAASRNVFEDPRYDKLRDFAALAGIVSAAAAPLDLDDELRGALLVCYGEAREFTPEELTRLERLAQQTELAVRSARQRESLARLAFETALALTEAIESRDPYTGDHCRRLAEYAGMMGVKLALPAKEIEVIRLGAALHDMGKIVVPDSILKKPGRLTPEEYTIIKQHCYSGGQICKRVGFLMNAYPVVYHHHERWDGRGYPDGLAGEKVPLGARIFSVVDAFDAMTSDRPYRDAMPLEEATAILQDGAGRQWDPRVVRTLLESAELQERFRQPHEHMHAESHGLVLPQDIEEKVERL
jgi:HD-GYP domain-containing protein (c-di-GMP phosphodiesterase class II)